MPNSRSELAVGGLRLPDPWSVPPPSCRRRLACRPRRRVVRCRTRRPRAVVQQSRRGQGPSETACSCRALLACPLVVRVRLSLPRARSCRRLEALSAPAEQAEARAKGCPFVGGLLCSFGGGSARLALEAGRMAPTARWLGLALEASAPSVGTASAAPAAQAAQPAEADKDCQCAAGLSAGEKAPQDSRG